MFNWVIIFFHKIIVNNRVFTSILKEKLEKLSEDKKVEKYQTVGFYVNEFPKEMNVIKRDLARYVPIGKDFKWSWKMANQALTQERSLIRHGKKNRN